jgi:autotransporter-associated beta strand protein
VLDLAGAPVLESQARLQAAALVMDDARLTVTRTINNNTPHRTTFTGGTFTGEAWIETASSSGGGGATVIITGPVGGSGGLVKSGPGNLGLNGNNSFTGPSELLAGTIWLNSVTGLGSPDGGTTLAGGTLYLLNGSHTAPIAEPFTVAASSNLRSGNGFEYDLEGRINLQATLNIETDGGTVIHLGGALAGAGTINKSGPGLLVLAGDNSFGSGTLVFGGGQDHRGHLRIESSTALGNHDRIDLASQQAGVSGIQLAGDVTLSQNILTRGRANATTSGYILRNLSGDNTVTGDITITAGGGSYAIVCDDGTLTLNGTLSSNVESDQLGARLYTFNGAGDIVVGGALRKGGEFAMQNLNVTKDGSGTLTLAGINDYTGNTNLNAGTTRLTGSIMDSAVVTLGADAVLDVSSHGPSGYAFGAVQTLRGGGTLVGNASTSGIVSPGFTTGVLSVDGDFTFRAGSTLVLDLDAAGAVQIETATLTSGVSPEPDAALIAAEIFDYPAGTQLSGLSGGSGFADAWANSGTAAGSVIQNGVLTLNGAGGNAASFRTLANPRGADGTTTWLRITSQRTGPKDDPGRGPGGTQSWIRPLNFALFNGGSEVIGLGEGTRAENTDDDVWGLIIGGNAGHPDTVWTNAPLGNLTTAVVRIDHRAEGDTAWMWIDPASGAEPSTASAAATTTGNFGFNRIRPFAGAPGSGGAAATGTIDDVFIAETWDALFPGAAGSQTYHLLVTLTAAAVQDSPLVLNVPVSGDAGMAGVAAAVRSALAADSRVAAAFAIGGAEGEITLTRLAAAANDATLNLAIENGSPSAGIAPAPVSANTRAGVAPGNDSFAVSGALDITGATLDLDVIGSPTAPAYVIATYGSLTGTFAAMNHLPAGYVIDYAYQSGTAIALVSGVPADGYSSWAAANGIAGQAFDGDFDGDGISNGLEYALAGLSPARPDEFPGSFDKGTLTFTKRPEAVAGGDVRYVIEASPDLSPGSWAAVAADVDSDEVISFTLPGGRDRLFLRLRVDLAR